MNKNLNFIAPYKEFQNPEIDYIKNPYEICFRTNGLNLPQMDGDQFFNFLEANRGLLRKFGYYTSDIDLFGDEEEMRVSDCRGLNLHVSFHIKGDYLEPHKGKVLFAYSLLDEYVESTRAFVCCAEGLLYLYNIERDAFYYIVTPGNEQIEEIAKKIFGDDTKLSYGENDIIKVEPSKPCLTYADIQEFSKLSFLKPDAMINENGKMGIVFRLQNFKCK